MAFVLAEAKPGKTRLETKSGLPVIDWFVVDRPNETFFPIRALIKTSKDRTELIEYNHNGRRFINVESELDLMVAQRRSKRRRVEPWPYDCMPEPLRAIAYIRAGEIDKVKLANKNYSTPATKGAITNIEIGCTE
jgi:hypothetical protein